jgi:transposase-like protein
MTLPDERYRAMRCGYQFLMELCNPAATPKVPRAIRERARSILRHYPGQYHFEMIAQALPNEFSKTSSFLKLANKQESNDDEFDPPPRLA